MQAVATYEDDVGEDGRRVDVLIEFRCTDRGCRGFFCHVTGAAEPPSGPEFAVNEVRELRRERVEPRPSLRFREVVGDKITDPAILAWANSEATYDAMVDAWRRE